MTYVFLATAAFGLEGLVASELRRMGLPAKAEQGGARFEAEAADAFRANLWLRTADRVLMILCECEVRTFEELFQAVSGIPWENLLARDANIPVSGKCVRSQLMSVRDCQAVAKKAIVNRLMDRLRVSTLPETGAPYPVEVAIHTDRLRVTLDMSGDALNRRGYRTWNGEAPLRETLAAALVELSQWRPEQPLYDPCCGTGTLLIEAAMRATRRAPGLTRSFACERYGFMPKPAMDAFRKEAAALYQPETPFDIGGSDIDGEALDLCNRHIRQAGFEYRIPVEAEDLRRLQLPQKNGVFLCNPPYGERLSDQESCRDLYRELGRLLSRHPGWSLGLIASDPSLERYFGRRCSHKRRLYNGRLECEFFLFGDGTR
ncbi:MAG TPA: class I SAM-dependent RNA methyltransferase [Candidatus Limiplasma sp.]|nr:class I SAM-dependent RNA methyltransferase [Candidatus Limiplasma sp.]HPS80388.1 class I SAM-dependent RNA methyltransferase [Candidatus Limiplasma sp.]